MRRDYRLRKEQCQQLTGDHHTGQAHAKLAPNVGDVKHRRVGHGLQGLIPLQNCLIRS
jgi:hypothetical protein